MGSSYHESEIDPEEHYTDTHGYTELNFAAFAMFGKRFCPRIRGLHRQWIYWIDPDKGSTQIAVEIQHKDPFLADKGAIEHVLAVEDDVVPFDRADVLYQGGVDAFLCEISRKHRPRDLLSLPIGFKTGRSWPGVYNNVRLARR